MVLAILLLQRICTRMWILDSRIFILELMEIIFDG